MVPAGTRVLAWTTLVPLVDPGRGWSRPRPFDVGEVRTRMFRRRAAVMSVLLMTAALTGAGRAFADPAGFAFLEIPAGARASALGGAFSSMAQGVEAVYANPAGLESVRGVELAATHYE